MKFARTHTTCKWLTLSLPASPYSGVSTRQARIVGLCHGYHGVFHLAHVLGLDPARLSFEIPGVNHFVFLTGLFYEGKNVLPLIDEWIEKKAPAYWETCHNSDDVGPKPVDVYRRLGVFPIGDTANPGGGAWPFWYHTDDETEKRWQEDPWNWYQGHFHCTSRTVEDVKRISEDTSVKVTDHFQPKKSGEVFIEMIESIACDIARPLVVNVPNTHAVRARHPHGCGGRDPGVGQRPRHPGHPYQWAATAHPGAHLP